MIEDDRSARTGRRSRMVRWAVAAGVVTLAGGLVAAPVLATAPSGFHPAGISLGNFGTVDVSPSNSTGDWHFQARTNGDTDIGVDDLVIDAGGSTGWHSHEGATFETVKSGTMTVQHGADCSITTYHAGDSYYVPAHQVHNLKSSAGAEYIAVQVRPHGTPPLADAPAPAKCP